MCALHEMDSDSLAVYLRGKAPLELYLEHRDEIELCYQEAMILKKERPIPPNIIIRCKDGERMSLPIMYQQLEQMRSM